MLTKLIHDREIVLDRIIQREHVDSFHIHGNTINKQSRISWTDAILL
mgnify:CR=1 FL=1